MTGISFGKRLREFRAKANLTQKKLANAAGLSDAYLAQIEIGDRSPSMEALNALSAALGVDEAEKNELIVLYEQGQRERVLDKEKNRELTLSNARLTLGSPERIALERVLPEGHSTAEMSEPEERHYKSEIGEDPETKRSQTRTGTRPMATYSEVIRVEPRGLDKPYYLSRDVAAIRRDLETFSNEIDGIPSVCLVGLGRCGTNIALGVSMLAQRAKDDYEAALATASNKESSGKEDNTTSQAIERAGASSIRFQKQQKYSTAAEVRARNFFRKISYFFAEKNDPPKPIYLVIPVVLIGDLDSDIEGRISASEYAPTLQAPYNKLKMLDFSHVHRGGAGNVPLIGEYLTKAILNKDLESITNSAWKLYHSYLIDSAGFKENKSRVFFYIFSAGGGTGSGASGEFGLAQQYAYHSRIHNNLSLTDPTTDVTDLARVATVSNGFEPIFSAGIAVLPQFDTSGKEVLTQAIHLNAGRLLCKYLAEEWRFSTNSFDDNSDAKLEDYLRPWNALMLISNNMMTRIDGIHSEIDVTKMEKMANKYVAQQILNLLTAGAQTVDYDHRFIREAGLNIGDMVRLDANDLYMSVAGPLAVAYAEALVQKKDSGVFSVKDVFFRSLDFPNLNSETSGIEGISILPQSSITYEATLKRFKETQDESEKYAAFSSVKCFVNCPSTVTIISIPKDIDLGSKNLHELKQAQDRVFPHTKLKRYALIRAASSNLSLTTIITRSACLSDEVVALLFAYIKRCFAKEEYRDGPHVEEEIIRYLTQRLAEETGLRGILRDVENPAEVMLANWMEVKSTHESKYRDFIANPQKFVSMYEVLLTADDVLDALRYIAVTLRHKAVRFKTPELTELMIN